MDWGEVFKLMKLDKLVNRNIYINKIYHYSIYIEEGEEWKKNLILWLVVKI